MTEYKPMLYIRNIAEFEVARRITQMQVYMQVYMCVNNALKYTPKYK